jgi:hypothetical protein
MSSPSPSELRVAPEDLGKLAGFAVYPNAADQLYYPPRVTFHSLAELPPQDQVRVILGANRAFTRDIFGSLLARDYLDPQALSIHLQTTGGLLGTGPRAMTERMPAFHARHIELLNGRLAQAESQIATATDEEAAIREAATIYMVIQRHKLTRIYPHLRLDAVIDGIKLERRRMEALGLPKELLQVRFGA